MVSAANLSEPTAEVSAVVSRPQRSPVDRFIEHENLARWCLLNSQPEVYRLSVKARWEQLLEELGEVD
jgi:hypothetical protein